MLMDRSKAFSFEALTLDDAPEILDLVESLGWTHVMKDLKVMLQVGVFLGAKDKRGGIIATGAFFPYGTELASIGMIMVRPENQKQGYGRAVMDVLHDHEVAKDRTLCLIATDEGEPLYKKCGYQVAGRIRKFFGSPEQFIKKSSASDFALNQRKVTLRTMHANDLESIIDMDAKALGANRHSLFELRFFQSDYAVIAENKQREVVGFVLAVPQREQHHLGPMVAPDSETALAMIGYIAERSDKELRIDVPEDQQALHGQLPSLGFRLIANPPAMIRNHTVPGRRENYWSIMSQAYA